MKFYDFNNQEDKIIDEQYLYQLSLFMVYVIDSMREFQVLHIYYSMLSSLLERPRPFSHCLVAAVSLHI